MIVIVKLYVLETFLLRRDQLVGYLSHEQAGKKDHIGRKVVITLSDCYQLTFFRVE